MAPAGKKGGRPKGSKTNPNSPRMLAAAQKRLEKAQAILKTGNPLPLPPSSPVNPVSSTPSPAAASSNPALPSPEPAAPLPPAQSDKELFGATPSFDRPPEHFAGGQPGPQPSPIPEEIPAQEPGPGAAPNEEPTIDGKAELANEPTSDEQKEQQRPLATMIWDSIVSLMAVFIGSFWLPRKVGSNLEAGEIPYDEREMVIVAWCEYLVSVGMAILTPGQKLAAAIANYSFPRLFHTIEVLKKRYFAKKPQPGPVPGDTRHAQTNPQPQPRNETPA